MTTYASPTHTTIAPTERFASALNNVRDVGNNGWKSAECPGHDDRSKNSLSFREGDKGGVIIKCHAGCDADDIIKAVGLAWKDLYANGDYKPEFKLRPKLELIDLAVDKLLPWQFLLNLGVQDEYKWKGSSVIQIPYYLSNGEQHTKIRVRTETVGKKGSRWDEDTPGELIPYGLHKLDMARKQGYLLIGEGESDGWTCWFHDVPYLGIPGATNEKCLDGTALVDISKVYIIQEPDNAGQGFYKRVHKQLRDTGYKGEIFAMQFKKLTGGHKDPNDLHKHLKGKGFKDAILAATKQATTSGDEIDRNRPKRQKLQVFKLRDLQEKQFAKIKWAIPDVLPEGVTLLVGKPKLGKSWMLLSMMCGIACGGVVLGNVPVEEGEVLYLALEDNERRLKDRANIVLRNTKASPNFDYQTSWPRVNEGGLEALEEYIQEHPGLRLIGIDTWAKFKPRARPGGNKQLYDEDYDALTPLQELAGRYNVSIVLVHHMRKQESEDPQDMISGSVAMQGAVDGFLLLFRNRGETDARLLVSGRDIEQEEELVLTFEQEAATWKIKGEADEVAGTPEKQAIIDVLNRNPEGLTNPQIASKLKKNPNTNRNLLVKLRNEGLVTLQGNTYTLTKRSKYSNHSQCSKYSNHSNLAESAQEVTTEDTEVTTLAPQVTTVVTTPIVTSQDTVNPHEERIEEGGEKSGYYTYYGDYRGDYSNHSPMKIYADFKRRVIEEEQQNQGRSYWWSAPDAHWKAQHIRFNPLMERVQACWESGDKTEVNAVLDFMRGYLAQ